jgi:hypothetical protein
MSAFHQIQAVLSGFWNHLAVQLAQSSLNHSYGYASADDCTICFARLPQNSGS